MTSYHQFFWKQDKNGQNPVMCLQSWFHSWCFCRSSMMLMKMGTLAGKLCPDQLYLYLYLYFLQRRLRKDQLAKLPLLSQVTQLLSVQMQNCFVWYKYLLLSCHAKKSPLQNSFVWWKSIFIEWSCYKSLSNGLFPVNIRANGLFAMHEAKEYAFYAWWHRVIFSENCTMFDRHQVSYG